MTSSISNFDRPGGSRRAANAPTKFLAGAVAFLAASFIGFLIGQFVSPFHDHPPIVATAVAPAGDEYYLSYSHGGVDEYTLYRNLSHSLDPVKNADVLFLGNSRAKYALSQSSLQRYFAAKHLSYYVLAFGYDEPSAFPLAIIRRYDLHPRYVVINADPFFGSTPRSVAYAVISTDHWSAVKFRFETVAAFAVRRQLHRLVPHFPDALTDFPDWIEFRSYRDGTIFLASHKGAAAPIFADVQTNPALDSETLAAAAEFKSEMDRRGCRIILTSIPPAPTRLARALAEKLEVPIAIPDDLPALMSIDGNHLDAPSAQIFTDALLQKLDPLLTQLDQVHHGDHGEESQKAEGRRQN